MMIVVFRPNATSLFSEHPIRPIVSDHLWEAKGSANWPLIFSASYYIDELTPVEEAKEFVQVQLNVDHSDLPEVKIDSHWSVLFNLVSRGCPTRASRWLTQSILEAFKVPYAINDPKSSDFEFNIPEITEDTVTEIKHSLNIIAGFQKILCWLLGTGVINSSERITLFINRSHVSLAQTAIEDLNEWLAAFCILGDIDNETLRVNIEAASFNENESRALLQTSERTYRVDWNFSKNNHKQNPRLLTGPKINYPSLGQFDENGRLPPYEKYTSYKSDKQLAAEYILQSVFRKHSFRAGQLKIINRAIQNLDVVGLLPTGGGKSLTYQFTSLLQPTVTIVIDPINSLMRDQFEKLIENGIDTCLYINSYNSKEEQLQNLKQLAQGYVKFAFVSPERLQISRFRDGLKSCLDNGVHIGLAVVDEAHCVSEWGHDFRHTYLRLADNLKAHCRPANGDQLTIMALTATASFDVLTDIRRELQMVREAEQTLPVDQIERSELTYHIEKVNCLPPPEYERWKDMEDWKRQKNLAYAKYPLVKNILRERLPAMLGFHSHRELFDPLEEDYYPRAGLIFCNTKSDARGDGVAALATGMVNQAASTLKNRVIELKGLDTEEYLKITTYLGSGDDNLWSNPFVNQLSKQSFENQGAFLTNKTNLMIATKAFGMGIDKPNIRFTVHYGLPSSVESFYQEAGRAGRDRNKAVCMILHHESDRYTNDEFLKNSFKGERKRARYSK